MKLLAICGSARENGNTAILLQKAIEGAKSAGVETELVNLFDLEYRGCIGCCTCKLKSNKNIGHCAVNDGLKPLLENIEKSDILVLGSPVYYGNLSGQMRSFTDRLLFQYNSYGDTTSVPKPKQIKTALIATMNASEEIFTTRGMKNTFENFAAFMARTFGSCELLTLSSTIQFDDYSKYAYELPDKEEKSKRKEKIAPKDLQRAFDLVVKLAKP